MRALASLGVYGSSAVTADERAVLDLANDFRRDLCEIYHERHVRMIDLRNDKMPELFAALVEFERAKSAVWEIERDIKAYHSDVRDRNAVTVDHAADLRTARITRDYWAGEVKEANRLWNDHLAAYRYWFVSLADWKNVKALNKRRIAYSRIEWPKLDELRAAWDAREHALTVNKPTRKIRSFPDGIDIDTIAMLGVLDIELDIRERELFALYQSRGLHSAIRAEIVEATQPKLGKDKPGMRYRYHCEPQPRPWTKITLQFPGGLTLADAIAEKNRSLIISRGKWPCTLSVKQQIGTAAIPRWAEYVVKMHLSFDATHTIQRWTLLVDVEKQRHFSGRGWFERAKRRCIPIIKELAVDRPQGKGTLRYDVTWTRRKQGVQVCYFASENINEPLVLPNRLLARRMGVPTVQSQCDAIANEWLAENHEMPKTGERQGVEALRVYCERDIDDNVAANLLYELDTKLHRATRDMQRAVRCIEKIYETVARRVCSMHDSIVIDPIDLRKLKRYDTRDLLSEDKIPPKSREYLQAVSPGKLTAKLKGWGLTVVPAGDASDDVIPPEPTDIFTPFIDSLGDGLHASRKLQRNLAKMRDENEGL